MKSLYVGFFIVACLSGLVSCKDKQAHASSESPQAGEPVAVAKPAEPSAGTGAGAAREAKKYFKQKCVVCHGDKGAGDGPGASALNPKPRAFGDAAWQGAVTDDQIKNAILGGGAAVGKSPIMPGNPDLKNKPEVTAELVKLVRAFKH
jgi:mono/diheme cytochrome c family protein